LLYLAAAERTLPYGFFFTDRPAVVWNGTNIINMQKRAASDLFVSIDLATVTQLSSEVDGC